MAAAGQPEKSVGSVGAELLREVTSLPDMLFVMGKGPQAVMEAWVDCAKTRVSAERDWVAVECEAWHCHLDVSSITDLRFVEEKDVHDPTRKAFSIRFLGNDGEPYLMVFFGKMYDDAGALRFDKLALFRSLQKKYELTEAD